MNNAILRARRRGDRAAVRELAKQRRSIPSGDLYDPGYRRLRYARYADDQLFGFIGPKAEAEEIKARLTTFLRDDLKLELSQDKTLITHARIGAARFLGYEITVQRSDTKLTRGRRSANGAVAPRVPRDVIKAKCAPYMKLGKPEVRSRLVNEDDHTIVATYGAEYRGWSTEKVWAEPAEVLHLADQIASYYHPRAALMVVTAAWTGERWGELAAVQRPNALLYDDDTGKLKVDAEIGALHESNDGKLWLGPPKTEASVREVTLPPFLVRLLLTNLDTHSHPHLFTTPEFELHRRSNFSRRAMRPCADGNLHIANPRTRLEPIKPGLTFHGLRHSHKTWMIDDGIPEIAQALRLGHVLKDKVQETYSHVAAAVEARLLQCLQDRWEKAVVDNAATALDTTWRQAA